MYPTTFDIEVQKQEETILEAGLRILAKMTKDEFEGLKLILKILIAKGGEIKCKKGLVHKIHNNLML